MGSRLRIASGRAELAAEVVGSGDPVVFLHAAAMPALVIWGELDFPHIQERSRRMAATMPNGSGHAMTGVAHLPSLERPAEVMRLVADFIEG